jgi:hypothetical protein
MENEENNQHYERDPHKNIEKAKSEELSDIIENQ